MNAPRWFRLVALLEGLSLLLLVLVAMPLKYAAGAPLAVKILGPLHGVFFIVYCVLLYDIVLAKVWSRRAVILAIAASFVPAGTLVFMRWLDRQPTAAAP